MVNRGIILDTNDVLYYTGYKNGKGGQNGLVTNKEKGIGIQNESWWGNKESGTKKICPQIFNRFCVTVDGFLTACCVDIKNELVYADLNKVSLQEAWHNEEICTLRRNHLNQNISRNCLCYNCMNNTDDTVKLLCEWASNQIIVEIPNGQ
jgi:hypothetical protein